MGKRAAVVIGVGRTGGLAELESPAQVAAEVSVWLTGEGFDVTLLTDADGDVHAGDVEDAIASVVDKREYEQLVVYFCGHGYWHGRADRWLLSGAPQRGSDAINLRGAEELAKRCGISNVVLISDACRSIPTTPEGQRVDGVDGFPNVDRRDSTSKVDVFKATSESQEAFEALLPVDDSGFKQCQPVLTAALRAAYREATPSMVLEIESDGVRTSVVPNRKLEDFLQAKVDQLLLAVNPLLEQPLEISVPSADHVYISRVVQRGVPTVEPAPPPDPVSQVRDAAIGAALPRRLEQAIERLVPPDDAVAIAQETMPTGAVVSGAYLAQVACGLTDSGMGVVLRSADGSGAPTMVSVDVDAPAVSLVGQFLDGRCFVIPALRDYIAHVAVDERGVAGVSYVPSTSHEEYHDYMYHRERIDRLRAAVAVSIHDDRLLVRTSDEAERLANQIRVLKRHDPALGLYAAHAYAAVGLVDDLESVREAMRDDLHATLFDVALLSPLVDEVLRPYGEIQGRPTPFCPLLTQTWSLMRPRGQATDGILGELMPYLENSLWTTFAPDAAPQLFDAIYSGRVV